jgi:predicted phage replisome organizer
MSKKYYWLKLHRDFFKRHDIRIIEGLENGKDYLLFYMKLLVESVDHEGELRFSETIPYNEQMLATITNTDVDHVRSAVKVFTELGMMEQFDDGTLYMNQIEKLIGHETEWAEKKRRYREQLQGTPEEDIVLALSDKSKRQSKSKSKSKSKREEDVMTQSGDSHDISPSPTRYNNLVDKYGKAVVDDYVQRVKDYADSKGKRYKNYVAAASNWLKKDNVSPRPGWGVVQLARPTDLTACPQCGGEVRQLHDEAICRACDSFYVWDGENWKEDPNEEG